MSRRSIESWEEIPPAECRRLIYLGLLAARLRPFLSAAPGRPVPSDAFGRPPTGEGLMRPEFPKTH